LPRCTSGKRAFFGKSIMKSDPTCLNCNSTPDYRVERHDININLRVLFTIFCCKFTVNFITQSCNFKTLQTRSFPTPLTVTIKFTSQNLGGTWPAAARVSPRWQKERPWERGCHILRSVRWPPTHGDPRPRSLIIRNDKGRSRCLYCYLKQ
jgi:hypothetical protein